MTAAATQRRPWELQVKRGVISTTSLRVHPRHVLPVGSPHATCAPVARGWGGGTALCLPQRAMKMEKKTVAGLSKRWLARAVAQAELIFQ